MAGPIVLHEQPTLNKLEFSTHSMAGGDKGATLHGVLVDDKGNRATVTLAVDPESWAKIARNAAYWGGQDPEAPNVGKILAPSQRKKG